jgi:hypothetical protein
MVGRGPLMTLLTPLFATLDVLPTTVRGDVRWCSLTVARGHLHASLGRVRNDCLIASGVLGGDAALRLKCFPEKEAMLTLVRAPCMVLGLCAHTPVVSQAEGLWLNVLALLPQRGIGQEIHRGRRGQPRHR